MTYQTTITKKGQILIPKKIREALFFSPDKKISMRFNEDTQELVLKQVEDIIDLAGSFKVKKPVSAVSLRNNFEKKYERI